MLGVGSVAVGVAEGVAEGVMLGADNTLGTKEMVVE